MVNAELEARSNLYVAGDAACFYDPVQGTTISCLISIMQHCIFIYPIQYTIYRRYMYNVYLQHRCL